MKGIFEYQTLSTSMGFIVKEYFQPHFTSPFHFHDVYELAFIGKSFGKLYAGNNVINFSDNDMFLFGPGFPHCFYNDKEFTSTGETAHAIVIFFREDFLGKGFFANRELSHIKGILQNSSYGVKLNKSSNEIKGLLNQLVRKKGMDALILILQILNRISKQHKTVSLINNEMMKFNLSSSDFVKLEPVLKYVMENFKEDLHIKSAASLACLSEAAFCRYFKRRTEQTFTQFVNRVRITHAIQLLATEEASIANISYECGFQNISYFNRQFKLITGKTPFNYRKSLVNPEVKFESAPTLSLA